MWNTIATFKENLSQIALDVQDAAEELEISGSREHSSVSDRWISHRFAQSKSPPHSTIPNGSDSGFKGEIDHYKAEIQRLQASEAEIKALSVNYAALLKEKEEQLSQLHEEYGSLRRTLDATNGVGHASGNESFETLTNSSSLLKVTGDQSPSRQQRAQVNTRSGNHGRKGIVPKQDASSNGSVHAIQPEGTQQKMELKLTNPLGNEKNFADLLEENARSLAAMQANHELEIKQLKTQLDKEHKNLAEIRLKLQGQYELNESSQKKLHILTMDYDSTSTEMKNLRSESNEKISEIKRLQLELNRRDKEEEPIESSKNLRTVIATLEKENADLKLEKGELVAALKMHAMRTPEEIYAADFAVSNTHLSNINEVHSPENLPGKEEMGLSLLKLEKTLKEACQERDKALQELSRLKQHLLDKELEESDKMDEDSKIIEELQANSEYQRAQILHLETALKQSISSQEEIRRINSNELQRSNEMINDLKQKLSSCRSAVDSKNVELLNLQTALGQYYAESEAKERLGRDLVVAKEESAKLSELLKDANQELEILKRGKEEIFVKLSHAERMLSEGKHTIQKLEEDNNKLRRALEQSMTRLNRMSLDSDYFVDRRIVIKLLVTYFQRNHSKEVLDLMVRMLGFAEEDKQRIGLAQQVAGKGVVRGVLGLPGRLVGGILGGSSPEVSAHVPSENQSFADLWVDYLLKETEERERRETAKSAGTSRSLHESSSTARISFASEHKTSTPGSSSSFLTVPGDVNQIPGPLLPSRGKQQPDHTDTEFSTVPLTLSTSPVPENSSRFPRRLPR